MRLGDKPLHLDPSLHYVSLSSGTNSCILHLRAFAASREKLPVADSPRSVPLCALSLKMHAACAHDLSRNQSVDQGGTRRPGGFFDGEIQSPPGTAGSTVWRHASPGRMWSACMATAWAGLPRRRRVDIFPKGQTCTHTPQICAPISGLALNWSVLSTQRSRCSASCRLPYRSLVPTFFIAPAGPARVHRSQAPHRFLSGRSQMRGISVSTVASLMRGPYCGLTIRRLLPCHPIPASRATALWDMLASSRFASTTWEAGMACPAQPRDAIHSASRAVMASRVVLACR